MTLEERVLNVLKNTFELDTVDLTCSQKTCDKWDSIGQLNLVVELETEFDVSLEPEEIGEMVSFGDIVMILKRKEVE
ncbi:MAG: acyl carrier protein [Bacteroidia bacterium]|nr:acyl carrier protein [Bacteroidia bacterium]